jgi:hypothetical protein
MLWRHAPIQAYPVAIDAVAGLIERLPDLGESAPAFVGIAKADLGVHHDPVPGDAAPLVLGLGTDSIGFKEG